MEGGFYTVMFLTEADQRGRVLWGVKKFGLGPYKFLVQMLQTGCSTIVAGLQGQKRP